MRPKSDQTEMRNEIPLRTASFFDCDPFENNVGHENYFYLHPYYRTKLWLYVTFECDKMNLLKTFLNVWNLINLWYKLSSVFREKYIIVCLCRYSTEGTVHLLKNFMSVLGHSNFEDVFSFTKLRKLPVDLIFLGEILPQTISQRPFQNRQVHIWLLSIFPSTSSSRKEVKRWTFCEQLRSGKVVL